MFWLSSVESLTDTTPLGVYFSALPVGRKISFGMRAVGTEMTLTEDVVEDTDPGTWRHGGNPALSLFDVQCDRYSVTRARADVQKLS